MHYIQFQNIAKFDNEKNGVISQLMIKDNKGFFLFFLSFKPNILLTISFQGVVKVIKYLQNSCKKLAKP